MFHETILGMFAGSSTGIGILIILIFILFILAAKKAFSVLLNAVWVTIAALLFPIVANRFLGLPVPTDTASLLSFVFLGLGLYLLYIFARTVYAFLSIVEKAGKAVAWPFRFAANTRKKETERKIEKFIREKEDEKKAKNAAKLQKPGKLPAYSEKDYVVLREPPADEKKKKKKGKNPVEPIDVIDEDE